MIKLIAPYGGFKSGVTHQEPNSPKYGMYVAISRAKALAIVVYSDTLLEGSPCNIDDIQRFNLFQSLLIASQST